MRVRWDDTWNYRCDECGMWNSRAWLVHGRLLCAACYKQVTGLDRFEDYQRLRDLLTLRRNAEGWGEKPR